MVFFNSLSQLYEEYFKLTELHGNQSHKDILQSQSGKSHWGKACIHWHNFLHMFRLGTWTHTCQYEKEHIFYLGSDT